MYIFLMILLLIIAVLLFFVIPFSLEVKAEKEFYDNKNKYLDKMLKDKEK